MYQSAKPLFFRTESPLHAGSGSDLGYVDLPIQREKHTDFPTIQSSSLKGAFREHLERNVADDTTKQIGVHLAFGYDKDGVDKNSVVGKFFDRSEDQDYAGSLAFTDARLLLFPLKSYKGVYALVTCPQVLNKLYQELNFICNPKINLDVFDFKNLANKAAVANEDFLSITIGDNPKEQKIILEEYAFTVDTTFTEEIKKLAETLEKITGETEILNRLVVLPDDVFRDFTKLSTEVITRTKIKNDTGTVAPGALFTEEYLPAESYLYTLVASSNIFQTSKRKDRIKKELEGLNILNHQEVINFFKDNLKEVAQIGGSKTLGKGIVKLFKSKL